MHGPQHLLLKSRNFTVCAEEKKCLKTTQHCAHTDSNSNVGQAFVYTVQVSAHRVTPSGELNIISFLLRPAEENISFLLNHYDF